jgi:polyhydroxybutyrate depolymerase
MTRTRISILAAILVALASCGGSSETKCGSGGPLEGPGGDAGGQPYMERTLRMEDGTERTYLLRLPQNYDPAARSDVIFTFHGSGSGDLAQLIYSNFLELADRDGVILVAPDSNITFPDRSNPLATYWDSAWEANLRVRDFDIDFTRQLVESTRNEYCVGDFHAAGMSAGGDMTSALQCLADSPFKAYAPVTYMYYNEAECADAPPSPLIYFHGSDDFVVPIGGSGPPWNDPPVPEAMQRWADHNGCSGTPVETRISDEVVRYHWEGCSASTEWYLVEGGGHTWPGSLEVPVLGYTTYDISASELIWDLFFGQE